MASKDPQEQQAPPGGDKLAGNVRSLLEWARSLAVHEKTPKGKADEYRRAVDAKAKKIVVFEAEDADDEAEDEDHDHHPAAAGRNRFRVTFCADDSIGKRRTFQVRRNSVIRPPSENIITRFWLENAVAVYEDNPTASIVSMTFHEGRAAASFEAHLEVDLVDLAGSAAAAAEDEDCEAPLVRKTYEWVIEEKRPNQEGSLPAGPLDSRGGDRGREKDTFMVSGIGTKLAMFLNNKSQAAASLDGGRNRRGPPPVALPFRPVVFSDEQYAIFDNLKAYAAAADDDDDPGDHLFGPERAEAATRALARLHGLSYAYFNEAEDDVESFKEILRLMIDGRYQPSAAKAEVSRAREELALSLGHLLDLIASSSTSTFSGSASLGQVLKNRYHPDVAPEALYNTYKDALTTTSKFSVLCHGKPTPGKFLFRQRQDDDDDDGEDRGGCDLEEDVKIVDFKEACYASAMTDVQLFLSMAVELDDEERRERLLTEAYYGSLRDTLESLRVSAEHVVPFSIVQEEFRLKEEFGLLAGALYYADKCFDLTAGSGPAGPGPKNPGATIESCRRRALTLATKLAGKYCEAEQITSNAKS